MIIKSRQTTLYKESFYINVSNNLNKLIEKLMIGRMGKIFSTLTLTGKIRIVWTIRVNYCFFSKTEKTQTEVTVNDYKCYFFISTPLL